MLRILDFDERAVAGCCCDDGVLLGSNFESCFCVTGSNPWINLETHTCKKCVIKLGPPIKVVYLDARSGQWV